MSVLNTYSNIVSSAHSAASPVISPTWEDELERLGALAPVEDLRRHRDAASEEDKKTDSYQLLITVIKELEEESRHVH